MVGVERLSDPAFLFLFADGTDELFADLPPSGAVTELFAPNTSFELTTIVSVKFDVVNLAMASLFSELITSFSCDCLMINVVGIAAGDREAARVVFDDDDVGGTDLSEIFDDLLLPVVAAVAADGVDDDILSSILLVLDDFELLSRCDDDDDDEDEDDSLS